jgi:uncharacterized protein YndB with AHSA1/START domain
LDDAHRGNGSSRPNRSLSNEVLSIRERLSVMTNQDFHSTFIVPQSPEEVFAAITDPRKWWTGDIEGGTDHTGDEFCYRYRDLHYSKQKVTELVPGHKVVWEVVDSQLAGPEDPGEWNGTHIIFEITSRDKQTELQFSHLGLVPDFECFDSCSNAWGFYINGSLRRLITTGEGPATPPWA